MGEVVLGFKILYQHFIVQSSIRSQETITHPGYMWPEQGFVLVSCEKWKVQQTWHLSTTFVFLSSKKNPFLILFMLKTLKAKISLFVFNIKNT